MHTLRDNTRLLLLPMAFLGLGCAATSTGGGFGRSAEDKNVRTIASIGDRPVSSTTGTPSSSAVANLDTPSRKSDERDLISGRVVDDRGDPVPNAKVRVADGGIAGGKVVAAKTDRSGAFTLHGLRPGSTYTLIAEFTGRDGLEEGRSEVTSPETDVEIALGGVDDEPVNRRRASNAPAGRTVSDRQPIDEPRSNNIDDRPLRLNREDVPSRSDVEDIDELSGKTSSISKSRSGASAIAVSGWRRGLDLSRGETGSEQGSNGTTDRAAKRASSRVPPPDPNTEDSLATTSRYRQRRDVDDLDEPAPAAAVSVAEDDDNDNPLPPAIHREGSKGRGATKDESGLPPPRSQPAKRLSQTNTKSPGSTPGAFILAKDELPREPVAQLGSRRPRDLIDELPPAVSATELLAADASEENPFADPFGKADASPKPKRSTTWGELDSAWKAVKRPAQEAIATRAPESSTAPSTERAVALPLLNASTKNIEACRYDSKKRQLINFRLPDLDGKAVTLNDFDSDLIVLDFWGTWCRPCLNSVPHLVELQERLGRKKLTIIGIACEEGPPIASAAHVSEVAKRLGINYKILLSSKDQSSPLQEALNITAFPTLVVLDKAGRVVWRDQGATETTLARLDRAVDPTMRASLLRR